MRKKKNCKIGKNSIKKAFPEFDASVDSLLVILTQLFSAD